MKTKSYAAALYGSRKAKLLEGEQPKQKKHDEADLHLQFCKWLKQNYPDLKFTRHEREKARTPYMQSLMKMYNSDNDQLPDFELLHSVVNDYMEVDRSMNFTPTTHILCGLYIEFKRPGRTWVTANNVIKADCEAQYRTHLHLWSIGRCAYFCNDLEDAKRLLIAYISRSPLPKQVYTIPERKEDLAADEFFERMSQNAHFDKNATK